MRINLFGGPGVGKTTLASSVFASLRKQGVQCALVTEWIKQWAYEGREQRGFDPFYAFARQLHSEEESLRHVGYTISDSPVYLQCMYADKNAADIAPDMWRIAHAYELAYPSLNYYVIRDGSYEQNGRWESEDEALEMDLHIRAKLVRWGVKHAVVSRDNAERICRDFLTLLNPLR
jgi:hypothetical protein